VLIWFIQTARLSFDKIACHFEVKHDGQIVDPYKGIYSSQSYWINQSAGERELPGVTNLAAWIALYRT
jgi:hypothetical protein